MAESLSDSDFERILEAPSYSQAETARLTGLTPSRIHRWLQGYEYTYEVKHGSRQIRASQEPVVEPAQSEGLVYASFLDLIDLLFVKQFLEHGVSLQKVRLALAEVQDLLGVRHFARQDFFIAGTQVFLDMRNAGAEHILALMTGGQWAISDVIEQLGKKIDFHQATGLAQRWFPLFPETTIVIDPLIAFGRPSLLGRGVSTLTVYDLFLGERKKTDRVSEWFDLTPREVEAAVDFEQLMAA